MRYTKIRLQGVNKEVYDSYFCRWTSIELLDNETRQGVEKLLVATSGLPELDQQQEEIALP